MKISALFNLWLAVLFMAVSSCSLIDKKNNDELLAVAYDEFLYRSELEGIVPKGVPATDSLEIVRQYIDNWIKQQVLIKHAESNLKADQKDFGKQLETFRNSLIIYAFESELIRQKLDTVVSEIEIQEFYEANMSNFHLNENLVRVSYVKIPEADKTSPQARKARQLLLSDNAEDQVNLIEFCDKSMFSCRPDDENWISFSDFITELSLEIDDQENFLKKRSFFESNDSLFTYLIKITDFKTREDISPVSLVKWKIINLILNRRKSELIKRMQEDIFNEAMKNKKVEIL
ncbi:MAG: hypothetical protein K0B15_02420 [Lentimicrobium sp.]|nr:hypothetical protein [Lentimicrobium sp.]